MPSPNKSRFHDAYSMNGHNENTSPARIYNTSNPTSYSDNIQPMGSSISLLPSRTPPAHVLTSSPVSSIRDTVMPLAWYRTTSSRPDMNTALSSSIRTMPSLSTWTRPNTNEGITAVVNVLPGSLFLTDRQHR